MPETLQPQSSSEPSIEKLLSKLPPGTIPERLKEISGHERKLIGDQWKLYCDLAKIVPPHNQVLERHLRGAPELTEGTLIHGIRTWSRDMIENIARMGIVSGELVGVYEDNETHFCADFFRVPFTMTISEYIKWFETTKRVVGTLRLNLPEVSLLPRDHGRKVKRLAFIVDASQPDLQSLLKQDPYRSEAARKIARNLLSDSPEDKNRLASVVCGIPSNFIAGILVTPGVENDKEEVLYLRALFGENMPIFNVWGRLITV